LFKELSLEIVDVELLTIFGKFVTSDPKNCGEDNGEAILEFGDCGKREESSNLGRCLKPLLVVGDSGIFTFEIDLLLVNEEGDGCDADVLDIVELLLGLRPVTALCKTSKHFLTYADLKNIQIY
jgi:hypothetical protein